MNQNSRSDSHNDFFAEYHSLLSIWLTQAHPNCCMLSGMCYIVTLYMYIQVCSCCTLTHLCTLNSLNTPLSTMLSYTTY